MAALDETLPGDGTLDGVAPTVQGREPSARSDGGSDGGTEGAGHDPRRSRPGRKSTMPSRIGRYTVLRRLGAGGMGVVFEAHDDRVDRHVALKLLRGRSGETERLRLIREAQAMAQLNHPNVVQVFEAGIQGEHAYLVMELVDGMGLDRWLEAETRPAPDVLEVFLQAGEGLAAAHAAGFVHRDFKPGNVMVGADGRVRVLDFGLARTHGGSSEDEEALPSLSSSSLSSSSLSSSLISSSSSSVESVSHVWSQQLTRVGAMMGTPAYMSPEQLGTEPVTAKSDQFSFCVALYEALFHQHPFGGDEVHEILHNVLYGQLRPPPEAQVPPRVRDAVLRGLALDPAERWPSMSELLVVLRAALRPSRWPRWAGVAAVVMVMASAGAWALLGDQTIPPACTGAEAKLAEVWGPSQRAAVEQALRATELHYAAQTWERVGARLDDYAGHWSSAYAQSCAAGPEDMHVLDRRMACLERLRGALGAQVEILGQADAGVMEQAVAAVEGLPSVQRCLEAAPDELAAPEEPELAARVDAVSRTIDRVEALTRSGKYDDARTQGERALEEAQALQHLPTEASAALALAQVLRRRGEFEPARQLLERAYFLGQQLGSDRLSSRAAIQLVLAVGIDQEDYDRGLEWARHAAAEVERTGDDLARGDYLRSLGLVLMQRGDYEEALDAMQRGLAHLTSVLEPDDLALADVMNDAGVVLRRLGRNDEAVRYYEQARTIYANTLGPDHPKMGRLLGNLAAAQFRAGRREEAVRSAQRSLAIHEALVGPEHITLTNDLNNLSVMFTDLARYDEAEHAARRAVAILEAGGTKPHLLCMAIANLGYVQQQSGRYEEAARTHRRAIAAFEEHGLEDHPDFAYELILLGSALRLLDELEQADAVLRRALAMLDGSSAPEQAERRKAHGQLAQVSLARGRFADAITEAEAGLELAPTTSASPHFMALMHFVLAQAHDGQGGQGRARALVHAREAARIMLEAEAAGQSGARELHHEIQTWQAKHDPEHGATPP